MNIPELDTSETGSFSGPSDNLYTLNCSTSSTNLSNLEATYQRPANSSDYNVQITNAEYNSSNKYIKNLYANVLFHGDIVFGVLIDSYTVGSKDIPYLIKDTTDWTSFVNKINSSDGDNDNYRKSYFKLTTDLELGNINADELAGTSTYSFQGIFDGDGHYINFTYTGTKTEGRGLFPYADGAVFKNLTISGTMDLVSHTTLEETVNNTTRITSGTFSGDGNVDKYYSYTNGYSGHTPRLYNVADTTKKAAGFVGDPKGDVTFVNCTNQVNVYAAEDAGGFVGASRSTITSTVSMMAKSRLIDRASLMAQKKCLAVRILLSTGIMARADSSAMRLARPNLTVARIRVI